MPNTITRCPHMLQFCRMRVAALNADGSPKAGTGNLFVTNQQISLAITENLEAGADQSQKTGCDEIAYSYKSRDKVKNLGFTLSLATASAELTQLLSGGDLLMTGDDIMGYAAPAVGTVGNEDGCSIEGWVKNIDGDSLDDNWPYIRFLFPKTFWTPADKTLENNPIPNNFTGEGQENQNWLDGPANDWVWTSNRLWQWTYDTDLPDASCVATELIAS